MAKETERPILVVSPNLLQAQRLFEDMVKLLGEDEVRLYPADELIAADLSVSSPELRAERIETLEFHAFPKTRSRHHANCRTSSPYAKFSPMASESP